MAIDLDGPTWREDAAALRDVAREAEIPVLVERSRSGRGAHIWLLFSRPVAVRVARAIATWLLTRAMGRRSISMASYDRLFPNQDIMPAGGFGNLIALPLQHARRAEGCTVFLDDDLEPHADQWSYLAGMPRFDGERAATLGVEAEQAGETLGLSDWPGASSGSRPRRLGAKPIEAVTVAARLGGRVELAIADLPAELRDRLRRTAAFANPVSFERERVDRSGALQRAAARRPGGGADESRDRRAPHTGAGRPAAAVPGHEAPPRERRDQRQEPLVLGDRRERGSRRCPGRRRARRPGRAHWRVGTAGQRWPAGLPLQLLRPPARDDHVDAALPAGTHQVRAEFAYAGGDIGRGGTVTLYVDGEAAASGEVKRTHPLYFSFDEGLDVGMDSAMPVFEEYTTPRGRFTGTINWAEIDLGDDDHNHLIPPEAHLQAAMTHQ